MRVAPGCITHAILAASTAAGNDMLHRNVLAGVIVCLLASQAWAGPTVRYVALVDGGKKAGHQIVETKDDGSVEVDFLFKDNGRGPELKERYTLADDGTLRTYEVKGSSTFGAKVDERFERIGDRATWKTTSDSGDQAVTGTALYASLGGTPQFSTIAFNALAKRPDGRLPMLPGGTLSWRKVATETVGSGTSKRKVDLMAMTGLGLTPQFVWATRDASPRLFASIYPGYLQLIEEGFEANAAALEARQKSAESEVLADMQARLGQKLPGSTLIRNARVFDSVAGRVGEPSHVLIRDGRIVSVTPATKWADSDHKATDRTGIPEADRSIDAANRILLPGLFDMHAHIGPWDGGLNLAAGITTVRDMGNDNTTLTELIADSEAGKVMLPRVVKAGFLEGESPYSARNGFVIEDLLEAKKAVDWYAANGYVQVKIYNSFPKAILRDTVEYAHAKGLRVSGHVPAFMRAQDVVDAGFDELQHINQLLLNFFVDETTDTRTLKRFYLVADRTAGLDFDSKPVQDFIKQLADKQIEVDPTLATFEFLHQRAGELSPIVADVVDHLPPDIQRGRRAGEMNIPDDATAATYTKSYDKLVEFVGRLHKAGVPIIPGTDEVPGFTLQHELALYVRAGMTPIEALQSATSLSAKVARVDNERGRIAPGLMSDLVLVDGDPTRDIKDIRNVALVIKGDTAYAPAAILDAMGIRPFVTAVEVGQ